jgi:hypothetical protein
MLRCRSGARSFVDGSSCWSTCPTRWLYRIVAEKTKIGQELWAEGRMILGHRLWPTAAATRVSRRGSRYSVVDGPFAETKEVLGAGEGYPAPERRRAMTVVEQRPARCSRPVSARGILQATYRRQR